MLWSLLFIFCIGVWSLCLEPLATMLLGGTDGAHCNMENIDLTGKNSSQSSTYDQNFLSYSSNKAYDGNYSTCSHTIGKSQSWWKIDLHGVYIISCISIFNKCAHNTDISGARVYIGNLSQDHGTNNPLVANITGFELCKSNVYTFKPTVGRYINMSFPGPNPGTLCEVNVTGTKIDVGSLGEPCQVPEGTVPDGAHCNMENIDLTGKNSSQSSTYDQNFLSYSSNKAYDGNYSTCSHTDRISQSWWKIDLQGVYNISCISIFNKYDANTNISGARVYIGNSRQNNGTNNPLVANITGFELCKSNVYTFKPTVGRYITVSFPEEKPVILCEVNVTGTKIESPFKLYTEQMEWDEALYHCRNHEKDLASILDEEMQAFAELEAAKADTGYVWLGLHYTCSLGFWFWVDNNAVTFDRWNQGKAEDCDTSGTMGKNLEHLWFTKSDYNKFNFICRVK